MKNRIKGKKGMVTSIGLVVLLTLLVCGASLFLFVSQRNKVQDSIYITLFNEQMARRELLLDNYLQTVTNRAAKGTLTKAEFITKFNDYLDNDKIPKDFFPELTNVRGQIKEENIGLTDVINNGESEKVFNIKLNLVIVPQGPIILPGQNPSKVSVEYSYDKTFEGKI